MGSFFGFRLNNTAVRRFHWWVSLDSWFCICFVPLVGWRTIYFYLLQVGYNIFVPLAGGKSIAMASGHSWSSIILSSPMLPPWYSLSPGGTNTCKQIKTGVTKSLFILSNFKNILWYLIRTKLLILYLLNLSEPVLLHAQTCIVGFIVLFSSKDIWNFNFEMTVILL